MLPAKILARLAAAGALSAVAAAASAQGAGADERQVLGSSVYRTYCSVCHGPEAKGDGPLADSLRFLPPDLTLLARKNGGTFPKQRVLRTVDGRNPVKGHGGPDMPVWGDAFRQTREGWNEQQARQRIEAVVEHLASLQRP
jgi:mono/diheme cytochrome c family protein